METKKTRSLLIAALLGLAVGLSLVFTGCAQTEEAAADEPSRFRTQEVGGTWDEDFIVLTDQETGVQYLYVSRHEDGAAVTPLLDADGKPMTNKED